MKADWSGFPQKATLGALGILFTVLVGYFIWLGTAMIEVRQKVTAIELTVKGLSEARRIAQQEQQSSNAQRLDALEEEGEGTE